MGHPKLRKKTFKKPSHPWQKERIDKEKILLSEYGLKNKKEIWRIDSLLRKYTGQAKKLITLSTPQAEVERAQLLQKLKGLGLLPESAKLEDVLSINSEDIMNRRLQTIVFRNNMAKTIRQARQFITHGHIFVGAKKITLPSYLVSEDEKTSISFAAGSELSRDDHPERAIQESVPGKKPETPKEDKKSEEKPAKEDKPKAEEKKEEKPPKEESKAEEAPKEEAKEEKPVEEKSE